MRVVLQTARLTLREFELEDWKATQAYEGDAEAVRFQRHGVLTPAESRTALQHVVQAARQSPRATYDLAVVHRVEARLVGRVGLRVTEPALGEAMAWWVVARPFWGQGLAAEAAAALLEFGFTQLGLHRVWADCDPRNTASLRVCEKLGMRREAHFREAVLLKGRWSDSIVSAVLAREWHARGERPALRRGAP